MQDLVILGTLQPLGCDNYLLLSLFLLFEQLKLFLPQRSRLPLLLCVLEQ